MDKRTLVAFGLMFLVLFGWSAIFGRKATDPAVEGGETTQTTPMAPEPAEATVSRPAAPAREPLAAPEMSAWELGSDEVGELIRVETELFRATFDRTGADLVSWELKRFDRVEGSAVDLVPPAGLDGSTQRANALQLFFESSDVDLRALEFDADVHRLQLLGPDDAAELVFRAPGPDGGELEVIYRFRGDAYGYDAEVVYRQPDRLLRPTHLSIAWPGGISSTEPDSTQDYNEFRAIARVGDEIHKKSFGDLAKNGGAKGRATYEGTVSWFGATNGYFAALVMVPSAHAGRVRFDGDHSRYLQTFSARLPFGGDDDARVSYAVYLGPMDPDSIHPYEAAPYHATKISEVISLGPGPMRWLSEWTLAALKLLYRVVPNYGWVIIIFSALTKLLFYPLTKSSTQSMRRMSELQPELTKMREKYKDDQQRQSKEMMELYKKHKINPLGGCLPMLVQMPVFFALFTILRKTIELRQAGFALWIDDLSRPDVLFHLPFTLPMFGNNFSILPFLMSIGMWWQTKLSQSSTPAAPGAMAQQMKLMGTMMPIFMFVMFYKSPSGLVLYWFVNTVLTALQTWRIHQKMNPLAAGPQAEPA